MNTYLATLKHDSGILKLKVKASSETAARQMIRNAENCPDCAISEILDLQFYNRDGSLTKYSFACGYVQRQKGLRKGDVYMYHEHGIFHVRTSNVWDTFPLLTEARKRFRELVKLNK